jgi:hypothetical protein
MARNAMLTLLERTNEQTLNSKLSTAAARVHFQNNNNGNGNNNYVHNSDFKQTLHRPRLTLQS